MLLRLKETNPLRFRCHTGHAYSAASLVAAVTDGMEQAMWSAIRALEEGSLLMRHVADHLRHGDDPAGAEDLDAQAREAHRQAGVLRQVVTERDLVSAAKS